MAADGSPTPRKASASNSPFGLHSDENDSNSSPVPLGGSLVSLQPGLPTVLPPVQISGRPVDSPPTQTQGVKRNGQNVIRTESPIPLTTSKLGNQASRASSRKPSKMLKIDSSPESTSGGDSPMNTLLAKLSEQQNILEKQKNDIVPSSEGQVGVTMKDPVTAGSIPIDSSSNGDNSISATPDNANTPVTESSEAFVNGAHKPDPAILLRLQKELEYTKQELARKETELSQTHIVNHTVNQALGPQSETSYEPHSDSSDGKMQYTFNPAAKIPSALGRHDTWSPHEETPTPANEAFPTGSFNRGRSAASHAIWNNGFKPGLSYQVSAPLDQTTGYAMNAWNAAGRQPFGAGMGLGLNAQPGYGPIQPQQFNMPGSVDNGFRGSSQLMEDAAHYSMSRMNPPSRPTSAFGGRNNGWGGSYAYNAPIGGPRFSPPHVQGNGMYQGPSAYHAGPVGSRLSPTAAEFSVVGDTKSLWGVPGDQAGSTYISPNEPINYRRLLDRNMNCNWDLIVNKIVQNNDQQASIFLQQKLKVGTAEQKFAIVESIISQAYPLMINRFGNFLVQRCFEHGTQEQVIAIAQAIRGNTLQLSMDAFGCHVIQKAFDAVPEEYKAIMVHELLRRIPETVVHRYACHVWQKLFELRWSDSPPQIMKYVNEALRGMWHEVALGETGSLVVQNIFENCLEEDKRPCIEEVLASIDIISHGQFGNWCIQHICEHGAPQDRNRAIDHILRYATEYSMDQYASKVIEKCLKIGGTEFLDRYLERVCEGRADRPRMPLVDIAGDQFGNYLIQYILTNSSPQHREIVASHVRKHMVSLRGSKYGSRVAMLCSNPAYATRPGPPAGMQLNRNSSYSHGRGYGGYR